MGNANALYHEAQRLVRIGQPVFPCHASGSRAKAPLTRNGLHDATCDLGQIKAWLREHRAAALAVPTGIKFDVLDVDCKGAADGRVHLTRLRELGLLNGCKKIARTPSGGWHLYFRASKGLTNRAKANAGFDLRALGGYVLAPPSRLATDDYSGQYIDEGETTGSTDEPLYWDLIMGSIEPINTETKKPVDLLPSERRASLASLREWVSNLVEGERNNGFHWAVCRCIENGLDPNELVEAAIYTGLDESEVSLTVNSALRRAGVSTDDLDTEAEAMFPDDLD